MSEVDALLRDQAGVISRRQVLAAGELPNDIRRRVRRREWAQVHPGVYVDHTGPLTWLQRAWAAVLYAWPSALSHDSALRAADGPGRRDRTEDEPIHVAVDRNRPLRAPGNVLIHRTVGLATRVSWNLGPPRLRIEHAALDLAAEAADDFAAVSVLADVVQSRRTTVGRLADALGGRQRIARRAFLSAVLRDVGLGTCSVLEHGYLTRVERPHGLPRPRRQSTGPSPRTVYRDVEYDAFGLVVELDGRLFHDTARARDRDLDRDLEAAIDGRQTVRLGWGQVIGRPCETAPRLAALLRQRGWAGQATTCPQCERVDSESSGDSGSTRSA